MLAANTADDIRIAFMAELNAHLNELRNTRIDRSEGVVRQDALCEVLRNEFRLDIVTREAERGLREVVRAE